MKEKIKIMKQTKEPSKYIQIAINIPRELGDILTRIAKESYTKKTYVVRGIVIDWLKEREKKR